MWYSGRSQSVYGQVGYTEVPVTGLFSGPFVADFTATQTQGTAPLTENFSDTSPGYITNRFWIFGDGTTLSTVATNVFHTFTVPGTNTVILVVSGPWGVRSNVRPNCVVVASPSLSLWQMGYFNCTNCPQADTAADPDGDGMNNLAEFAAGTDPTDPISSPFQITAITKQSNDVLLTWTTVGGTTNIVQAGGICSSSFYDISPMLLIPTSKLTSTNYHDLGGATNSSSRYWRVRLVP